ncbi:glycosyltransferase [Methylosinus sp. RM1]|uniref:glycosyltransferase n=1 Tax=Methylosinus sp. RM1 TaxID=2583817 RepID=UPI00140D09B3|nr:glycosyltransferase [Methylosinus sp. RM1]
MKVLHVIASVDRRGGGPIEGVFSSSAIWSKYGHERHILCLDPIGASCAHEAPIPTFAVGSGSPLRRILPWLRYGYTPNLGRWLRIYAGNYDAVIVNGLWNYSSFGSWRALRDSGIPYFVFTHGMLDPWFNKTYPIKTFFKSIFWRMFEHKVLRDARGVLFTSEEERELAPRSFSPYSANPFVVGYGACDVDGDPAEQRAAFMAKVPDVKDRKLILFLSRIHPKKGVDLLIRAFARHALQFCDIDLVIAGPDQTGWKSSLQKLAAELGVADRIHWPGMLSGDAKWGAFRSSEFFILPSHQENFGIVVAEALALGVPVLITNKVNIWREIEADGAGLVVCDDIEAVSAGWQKMCAMSRKERGEMSSKARASFEKRYDLERNAMDLLDFLIGMTSRS